MATKNTATKAAATATATATATTTTTATTIYDDSTLTLRTIHNP